MSVIPAKAGILEIEHFEVRRRVAAFLGRDASRPSKAASCGRTPRGSSLGAAVRRSSSFRGDKRRSAWFRQRGSHDRWRRRNRTAGWLQERPISRFPRKRESRLGSPRVCLTGVTPHQGRLYRQADDSQESLNGVYGRACGARQGRAGSIE